MITRNKLGNTKIVVNIPSPINTELKSLYNTKTIRITIFSSENEMI